MRVDPDGTVRVVAGNGLSRFAGDGGSARAASLHSPSRLTINHGLRWESELPRRSTGCVLYADDTRRYTTPERPGRTPLLYGGSREPRA